MEKLIKTAQYALDGLKKAGAQQAVASVAQGVVEEINVDAGEFSLIRSVYTSSMALKAIKDKKKGTISINQLDESCIDKAIEECMASVDSGVPDDAVSIAELEENKNFTDGVTTPDKQAFLDSVIRFTEKVQAQYPQIMLEQVIASFSCGKHVFMNTNGVCFTEHDGSYSLSVMYSAHDGEKTSSFNCFDLETLNPHEDFLELGQARTMFERAVKELDAVPFEGKMLGTAVFSPICLTEVLGVIEGSFCGDFALIEKTSPWRDKLGQKVADDCFTLKVIPNDERVICAEKITGDGYASENYDIIENGILKSFCLSQYAANKTGLARAKSSSGCMEVLPGNKPFEEMIKGIEKGILVCRFSGGEPANNGEFSGVAKNSFLIENGKISHAITEAMISGNFADMLKNIYGISREQYADGTTVLPYVAFNGVTVSGK